MNYYPEFISNTIHETLIYKNNSNIINNRAIYNDIVYIQDNKVINIKERNMSKIAGILYLNKNTKYGFNSEIMKMNVKYFYINII